MTSLTGRMVGVGVLRGGERGVVEVVGGLRVAHTDGRRGGGRARKRRYRGNDQAVTQRRRRWIVQLRQSATNALSAPNTSAQTMQTTGRLLKQLMPTP
jgi:hypothetical protein